MAKITRHGGPSFEFRTPADVLRELGKLGPYEQEAEVLNECVACTTSYAADLDACPHCGTPSGASGEETAGEERDEGEQDDEVPFIIPPDLPYDSWLLTDLQDECVKRGLVKSGNKAELVDRLVAHDTAAV